MRLSRASLALALGLLAPLACGSSDKASAPKHSSRHDGEPAPATSTAAAEPATASASEIGEGTFESAALGVTKRYRVYLPPGYAAGDRRYPVVYLLHGLGGDEDSWVKLGLQSTADQVGLEAIVVMPDGDDGFYVDNVATAPYESCMAGRRPFGKQEPMKRYCVKKGDYDGYVARDLVAHVDAAYRTEARRESRAIAGLSMGGYGALYHGLRHPETFSIAVSHAGVASLLYTGADPYDAQQARLVDGVPPWVNKGNPFGAHFLNVFGSDGEVWKRHDPTTLAKSLEPGKLALYLDAGTADEFRLHLGAQMMHDILDERSVPHAFELVPDGHHDVAFWTSRLDDGLAFIKKNFER